MNRSAQGGAAPAGPQVAMAGMATPGGSADAECDAELISALIDGELDAATAHALLGRTCREPALRAHWSRYHLVQDALHSHEVTALASLSCLEKVERALRDEPALAAPRRLALVPRTGPLRWALPGLGIAAAAAVVALVGVPQLRAPANDYGVQAAAPRAVPPAPLAGSPPVAVQSRVQPDGLNEYLEAHRDLAGIGLMPRAAPLLRASLVDDR